MFNSVRLNAEKQFAATQKKAIKVPDEKETVQQKKAEHVANLRALRLAKEGADKNSAEMAAAERGH